MNPAELAEVTAGLPVDAEHFAVQRHLIDAARVEIADEEYGIGSWRHAKGVRSAW